MTDTMTLAFLGGAGTVTGSKYLLGLGSRRVLVDAGLFQGEKRWRELNWGEFAIPPASIESVLLTHAHLDHIGFLPALVASGFAGTVWCTEDTLRLSAIVLMDAGHLQEKEAGYAAQGGWSRHHPPLPLYTVADVERTLPLFRAVAFDTPVDLGGGLQAQFTRAGHILGSASIRVWTEADSVLFSGDLGRHDHPLLRPRAVPPGAAFVLVESTYGDREHPESDGSPHEELAAAIRRTIGRGGTVLIPAFAIDRTPVVLKSLAAMRREGRIPDVPIFVNSPMAIAGLDVYRDAGGNSELRPDLHLKDFMDLPNLREVEDAEESKRLNRPSEPCIIVSSSGMATGGRVLHHLEHLLPDPRNCVVFTGYQGAGTRGRQLLDGARELKFRGRFVGVRAEIVHDSEFSVHADASDLIDWLADLEPRPRTVFCTHGDSDSAEALADRIHRELGLVAVVPRYGEVVSLATAGAPAEVPWEAPAPLSAGPVHRPATAPAPVPSGVRPSVPAVADTHADDRDQVRVILQAARGQVAFLPEDRRAEVTAGLDAVLHLVDAEKLDLPALREAVNRALYAAAAVVDTLGGQSIVALLAHVPRVLG